MTGPTSASPPSSTPTSTAAPGAMPGHPARSASQGPAARPTDGFNWFRFWMRVLVAMIAFNVLAGLLTWYVIFPRLHPAH